MIIFWLVIAFLTAIALAFILIPFFWTKNKSFITSEKLNVALYKEQLTALQMQLQNAEITARDFALLRAELEKSLLQDVPKTSVTFIKTSQWKHPVIIILLIALPIIAIFLYWHWGHSQEVSQSFLIKQQAANVQAEIRRFGSVQSIARTLQQKLQQTPDPQGWFLLGKLYLGEQQFHNAVEAFSQANALKPGDADIMLLYAQSLFFANHESLNSQSADLLNKVLQKNPNEVNANNLLAINAYHHGDYQTAINYWEKLLEQFPANSEDSQNLLAMIDSAEQRLNKNASALKLRITVAIAAKLKNKVFANDTIFIYAKAVAGPPMPLAIVRKQVSDLPIKITLSQSDAMLPNLTLSQFKQIQIVARISKSGQAAPQAGDLEGKSSIINTHHWNNKNLIAIIVNQIL